MREETPRAPLAETAAVFASFFLLGLWQAAPSVTTGDAGEFAAAAAILGVAHAPGYALYMLAARAFGMLIPLGSWAYRTNLLSAACGALALALFSDALGRFGAGRAARLGAASVLGLTPLWREQSAVTEVFTLQVLCAVFLLWLVAAADERLLEPGPSAALGLVFGAGLGAHQTLALMIPALALAGRGKPGSLPRAFFNAGLGAAAGFTLHAALPLRAVKSPPLDWDHAANWTSLWRLLTRKDYGSLSLTTDGAQSSGADVLAAEAWRSVRLLGVQLGAAGVALAVIGAAAWKRAGLKLAAAPAWAWVLCAGPVFLILGRPPFDPQTSGALERFSMLPLLGAGLFVAVGLEALSRLRPAAGIAAALAAAAMLAPGAAAQSRRDDFLAHDYGREILRELPPGATLAMDGGDDTFYSLAFLIYAQGLRPDISPYDRGGVVFPGHYGEDFRELPHDLKEDRRRAVEGPWADDGRLWYSTLNPGLLPGWDLHPAGLLRRPARPGVPFRLAPALTATLPTARAPSASRRYRDRALFAFYPYQRGVAELERGDPAAGIAWLETAEDAGGDAVWVRPTVSFALQSAGYAATARRDYPIAERAYRSLARLDFDRADPLADLSVVLQREGRLPAAEEALREGLKREPRSRHAWETLGALLWAQARFPEAGDAYASAAELPGGADAAAWAARARAKR